MYNDNDNGWIIDGIEVCPRTTAQEFQMGTSTRSAITGAKLPKQSLSNTQEDQLAKGRMNTTNEHYEYSVLGYHLDKPDKYERRVVPLLEFLEKKFPQGHVLSLQLSHQMDITRNISETASGD